MKCATAILLIKSTSSHNEQLKKPAKDKDFISYIFE